jgi:hypothetical protein
MNILRIVPALVGASVLSIQAAGVVVDHTYSRAALTSEIVAELVKRAPVVHYAHRSDGSAVTWGLSHLAMQNASFKYAAGDLKLPNATTGIRLWDGMSSTSYVYAENYWDSKAGTDALGKILKDNPSIKYSSWTWCNEHSYWSFSDMDRYIKKMDSLEKVFPNVKFIWQTAAGRSVEDASKDAYQAVYNERLRQWAKAHDKILFDFEDLDTWHNGVQQREKRSLNGKDTTVPVQHPFWKDGPTNNDHHANDSMGIDKGYAFWTLLAKLEGLMTTGVSPREQALGADNAPRLRLNPRTFSVEAWDGRGWKDALGRGR